MRLENSSQRDPQFYYVQKQLGFNGCADTLLWSKLSGGKVVTPSFKHLPFGEPPQNLFSPVC